MSLRAQLDFEFLNPLPQPSNPLQPRTFPFTTPSFSAKLFTTPATVRPMSSSAARIRSYFPPRPSSGRSKPAADVCSAESVRSRASTRGMCGSSGARRVSTGASCSGSAVDDAELAPFGEGAVAVAGDEASRRAPVRRGCCALLPWWACPEPEADVRSNSELRSLMRREMESI